MQSCNVAQQLMDELGSDLVELDEQILMQKATATFDSQQQVVAAVYPQSVEHIQRCIHIASVHKLQIYPTSGGKNWGLGSKLAYVKKVILLDLKSFNKITRYDATYGTLRIEAGVSFEQLNHYLSQQFSPFFCSTIGGPKAASILGNMIELGDRINSSIDRLGCFANLEVVLPSGDVINTGMGRFPAEKIHSVYPWGVGPYIDGLFTQSSFGIVISADISLIRKPNYIAEVIFAVPDTSRPRALVNVLRNLMQQHISRPNALSLWNMSKVIGVEQVFPFDELDTGPLDLKQRDGAEPWFGTASVFAPALEMASTTLHYILDAVEPFTCKRWHF